MILIAAGSPNWWGPAAWAPGLWLGLGMTVYAMFHDGLVHGRFRSGS